MLKRRRLRRGLDRNEDMRAIVLLLLLLGWLPASGTAGEAATALDGLFDELAQAESEGAGRAVEDQIWRTWMIGPDETATAEMSQIMAARRAFDPAKGLEIAEALTQSHPAYAEAWNQKATLLYILERFDDSLEAIEATLALEPRHFGALAGKALILMQQGRFALGQDALREAVRIHPFLKERDMLLTVPEIDL